jgi:hypothetical protein
MTTPRVTSSTSAWFFLPKISSLRVDKIFWLCVTALAASLAVRLYNAYKSHHYAVNSHPLSKSLVLLYQSTPALDECATLLESVKDSPEKQQILFKLALLYTKSNPERAIQIARKLPSIHQLLAVAQEIPAYCEELKEAYSDFGSQQGASTLDRVECALKFETIFDRLKKEGLRGHADMWAQALTKNLENKLDQVRAWCALAMNANEPQYESVFKLHMMEACALCTPDILPPADLMKANMALAETYFSPREYQAMETALENISQLSAQESTLPIAEPLAQLLMKIRTTEGLTSPFITKLQKQPGSFHFNLANDLALSHEKLMEICLASAEIKHSINFKIVACELADSAHEHLEKLPGSRHGTECQMKANALKRLATLFHEVAPGRTLEVMEELEVIYRFWPSKDQKGKFELGVSILSFYNSKGFTQQSDAFFSSFIHEGKWVEKLVPLLTLHENCLSPAQKQTLVHTAQNLIPTTSDHKTSPAITNAPWVAGAALVGYVVHKILK